MSGKSFLNKTKSFLVECKRVLKVTRKPSKEELSTVVKVTGVGMLIVGLIGFIVLMIAHYLKAL